MNLLNKILKDTKCVEEFLDTELKEIETPDNNLIKSMKYTLLAQGKRLRPWLVLKSAQICGADEMSALRVAGAIECIHRYSLIHDDLPCFDNDDMRWGIPTNHKEFGEATAIIAGDALQSLAFEIITDEKTHKDAEVRCELIKLLSQCAGYKGMCGGQEIDTKMEYKKLSITEDLMKRNQIMKTGALFKFSCISGSILKKTDNNIIKLLEGYAYHLGLIFQMTDDLIDRDGFLHIWDEKKLRKEISKHIKAACEIADELNDGELKELIKILEHRTF